ncbi:putative 3-deoxy-D-manno-octulosonic-acid transferase (KDO transferase) [Mameliella alba]|uniref:3-deoxy-D-manno-octulosonic acid transferase n=1 Tax=Mameliella alba TaxID=561184 RepID=A0A0B3SVL7_9RHOB|nr:putative 3-deoxy-D-manno-octulosonic-acid transferase (KDO transferase) [Mameliella alba]
MVTLVAQTGICSHITHPCQRPATGPIRKFGQLARATTGSTVFLYRLLLSLFAAGTLGRALRRGGIAAARSRLTPGTPVPGAHVWLHGASNGELASVRPLLERLIAARPDLHWLVTANTDTGVALAKRWDLPRVTARLAPLDLRGPTRRIMLGWQVRAHIVLEAELWPNRFITCPGPVLLLGARMSAGTARSWARLPKLARRTLNRVGFASAQDAASAERLADLGLPASARGPVVDLKAFYAPPAPVPDPGLDAALPRHLTWLAASTHEGDDQIALAAHKACLRDTPNLKLILAPRHPRRPDEIAEDARALGMTITRRSRGEDPAKAQVYLADTLGEMPLWYARAGRVFIGGTLSDRGGHTPYEPAAFGAALIHGPDTRNFTAAFSRLRGIALEITDADTLAGALAALQDPAEQEKSGSAACAALRQDSNLDALAKSVLMHLPPPVRT